MVQLRPGEKHPLSDFLTGPVLRAQLTHDLAGADISVFGIDAERRLRDDRYFVFYNQTRSPMGEIVLQATPTGGVFDVNLDALPKGVERLVFVISHDTQPMSRLGHLRLGLLDAGNTERAFVHLTGQAFSGERALMIAEVYRHAGQWRVTGVAQGFQGGLDALLAYFGGQASMGRAAPPTSITPPPPPVPAPTFAPPAPAHSPAPAPTPAPPSSAASSGLGSTLQDFLRESAEQDRPGDVFELESSKMLEVKVRGRVWSKLGAMVAYRGRLTFKRASTLGDVMGGLRSGGAGGMLGSLMNAAVRLGSSELEPLVSIEGQGTCYLADHGKEISIIRLQGDALNVNGSDLLAFEDTVGHQITMQRSVAGMVSGGLFSVRMQGHGLVAIISHGHPLTLHVTPQEPVYTDPNATVAWSGHLQPEIQVNHDLRSMLGRGGGETLQMVFRGEGFVVVQPYEEVPAMDTHRD